MMNVYLGEYKRVNGSTVKGPSLSDLVKARDAGLDAELRGKLDATLKAMQAMKDRAETVETYDQMIAQGNTPGNAVVQAAIAGLVAQTRSIEHVISSLVLDRKSVGVGKSWSVSVHSGGRWLIKN